MIKKVICLIFFALVILVLPKQSFADASACQSSGVRYATDPAGFIKEGTSQVTIKFLNNIPDGTYRLRYGEGINLVYSQSGIAQGGKLDLVIDDNRALGRGTHTGTLMDSKNNEVCGFVSYKIGFDFPDCKMTFSPSPPVSTTEAYRVFISNSPTGNYNLIKDGSLVEVISIDYNGIGSSVTQPALMTAGNYKFELIPQGQPFAGIKGTNPAIFCKNSLSVFVNSDPPRPISPAPPVGGPPPVISPIPTVAVGNECAYKNTIKTGAPNSPGTATAIGCVPTDPIEFIGALLRFTVGIIGGISLLIMVMAVFQMITSAGNPDNLKQGHERFTSAIIGMLVVIFSVLLLRIIGVDILGLGPALGVGF